MEISDKKDFAQNYFQAVAAAEQLSQALIWIGMSGDANLKRLKDEMFSHAAITYASIERDAR